MQNRRNDKLPGLDKIQFSCQTKDQKKDHCWQNDYNKLSLKYRLHFKLSYNPGEIISPGLYYLSSGVRFHAHKFNDTFNNDPDSQQEY